MGKQHKTDKLLFPDDIGKSVDTNDPEGGALAMHDTYAQFEVDTKLTKAKDKAKKVIQSILEIYLDSAIIDDKKYIKSIASIESMTLGSLLFNLSSANHALSTVMRQLDGGGYVSPAIFDTIMSLQKNSITITMEVSRHVRNIPEYFKFVKNDVVKYDNVLILDATGEGEQKQLPAPNQDDLENDGDYSSAPAFRGSKDLIKTIQEGIQKQKEQSELDAQERKENPKDDVEPIEIDLFSDEKDVEDVVIETID